MEFRRWRIGEVEVTRIAELVSMPVPPHHLFPDASVDMVRQAAWLHPHFASADGDILLNFQCFLIAVGDRRILVDTCIGEGKQLAVETLSHLTTGFLETLERAGAGLGDVDTVLCTHLHFDHVGWNTRLVEGEWRPTFPNARYLFGETELAFALGEPGDPADQSVSQSVRPVIEAGLVDRVASDHRLCPEVRLLPTPGHTPGHVSVMIESGGQRAIISGDAIHHPLQFAHPGCFSSFCHDPAMSSATRRDLFSRLSGEPVLFIGTHFCEPTAGLVVSDGAAWRLEPVWSEAAPGLVPAQ